MALYGVFVKRYTKKKFETLNDSLKCVIQENDNLRKRIKELEKEKKERYNNANR